MNQQNRSCTGTIMSFIPKHSGEEAWKAVCKVVKNAPSNMSLEHSEILYYPYLHLGFAVSLSRFRGVKEINVLCCVSMTDGKEALITGLPPREEIGVNTDQILPVKVEREEAIKKAKSYLLYPLMQKEKILNPPLPRLVLEEFCYRPFYLFTARSVRGSFGLLVDALTTRYQTMELD